VEVERAARLTALLQHPAWAELVQTINEKADSYARGVTAGLMATGELPDDFEYKRGFFAGMKAVCHQPDVALRILDRDVRAHREEQLV
jgi:hypothetical protein